MEKTVTVKGEKIKVDFRKHSYVRTHNTDNVIAGYEIYNINGTDYVISSISTPSSRSTGRRCITRNYKCVPFGDNDKAIIEYILNNQ